MALKPHDDQYAGDSFAAGTYSRYNCCLNAHTNEHLVRRIAENLVQIPDYVHGNELEYRFHSAAETGAGGVAAVVGVPYNYLNPDTRMVC